MSKLAMAELSPSKAHPVDLSPSEYFRRQIYAMFWFEESTLAVIWQIRRQRDVRDRLPAYDQSLAWAW